MGSIDDISQLCRLCLVKDQVNIPIFDGTSDIGQTFIKIESCLPVKVSRNDNLPKKICDGCSYKLDMLYTFRNTSIDSEKQLIQWLNQAGLSTISQTTTVKDPLASTTKPEIMVKQENFDTTDSRVDGDNPDLVDPQSFMIQQDHLGYEQEFVDFGEASGSNANDDSLTDEPAPKRAKRAAALKKAPLDDETEDDLDAAMQITKAEEEDEEEVDQPEYVEAPSTSADDQPGPSGVGKATTEAPSRQSNYTCNICSEEFPNKTEFLKHHMHQYGQTFNCCKCGGKFKTTTELYTHLEEHKNEPVIVFHEGEIVEEIVVNYDVEEEEEDSERVIYVLDDSQCVNEVVVHEEEVVQVEEEEETLPRIVQIEHGYVQTSSKPKPQPKKRQIVPDFSSTNYEFITANEEININHFKCLRCEQIFINKLPFFRHIEKGKCYINNCDVCTASFEKNSDFYEHYTATHTDRAICNFCFRTFMYEKNIKEHMMRHLDQFKHKCEECNKGFYTVREYRNHYKNRHMGIRHICTMCTRSFADEYYFKKHLATHQQNNIAIQ